MHLPKEPPTYCTFDEWTANQAQQQQAQPPLEHIPDPIHVLDPPPPSTHHDIPSASTSQPPPYSQAPDSDFCSSFPLQAPITQLSPSADFQQTVLHNQNILFQNQCVLINALDRVQNELITRFNTNELNFSTRMARIENTLCTTTTVLKSLLRHQQPRSPTPTQEYDWDSQSHHSPENSKGKKKIDDIEEVDDDENLEFNPPPPPNPSENPDFVPPVVSSPQANIEKQTEKSIEIEENVSPKQIDVSIETEKESLLSSHDDTTPQATTKKKTDDEILEEIEKEIHDKDLADKPSS